MITRRWAVPICGRPWLAAAVILLAAVAGVFPGPAAAEQYDADAALEFSQAAIGRNLENLPFTDSRGHALRLSEFHGRPLLISMVFTSCHHVCPALTQHLDVAVKKARQALGQDSFEVITVGFDTPVDTPEAMRLFAQRQGVDDPNWAFLSGSDESVRQLAEDIGFGYFPSPRGFDHINQLTVVDTEGVVYAQVYGAAFELPWLVEPLKQLVYGEPRPGSHFASGLVNRVKLFCTVYDPNTGRYRFDYSLFVGIAVGAVIVLAVFSWLLVEALRSRNKRKAR